ncbi:DUF4260 domain-containing protein [Microvirga alba]|uniref:DUF4260 domain-containing protein n=1 Tax=Microvirga alba TaxID=2791025 RepID=A0A931FN49_9HYPH|nr:DUF4260 domain-containing protein [Microvirga alba]MBF9233689.1 DUF4260 domain-containing protein [Microvirga alba]
MPKKPSGSDEGDDLSQIVAAPAVAGVPRLVLRLEGLVLFVLATAAYAYAGLSWWLYAILFLSPDLGFVAYGAGPRIGAMIYNILHSTIGPAMLAGIGLSLNNPLLIGLAAIWAAHIGLDRMLGYGLKYATAFADTHLGRIGRDRAVV